VWKEGRGQEKDEILEFRIWILDLLILEFGIWDLD
jgi:hypothetical protein